MSSSVGFRFAIFEAKQNQKCRNPSKQQRKQMSACSRKMLNQGSTETSATAKQCRAVKPERLPLHGAKGQAATGCVGFPSFSSLSSFIILLFLLPPPPLHPSARRQLRHILRTHSHRAVIRPDSTLRLVFSFHCIHLLKKKREIEFDVSFF